MKSKACSKNLALLIILILVIGVVVFHRGFVKIKIGPFYFLEFGLILWLPLAIYNGLRFLSKNFYLLKGTALFFAFGLLHLFLDFMENKDPVTRNELIRIFQHCILFVYPLLWMTVGLWIGYVHQVCVKIFCFILFFTNIFPNFLGQNISNISIGPLLSLPMTLYLHLYLKNMSTTTKNKSEKTFLILLIFFTFIPFWRMWFNGSMQRTSLLLLCFIIFSAPQLIECGKKLKLQSLKTSLIACLVIIFGFAFSSFFKITLEYFDKLNVVHNPNEQQAIDYRNKHKQEQKKHSMLSIFKLDFLTSMQHGEDFPDEELPNNQTQNPFQARFRRFCWKTAVSDWLEKPIFGLGFIPEVPSYILPDIKNTGGFESKNAPPVSGPHNSYLSILARMGIIGIFSFLFIGLLWLKNINFFNPNFMSKMELDMITGLLLFYIPLNGAIMAFFNVGLEAPHNSMVMWLVAGMAMVYFQNPKTSSSHHAT